MNKSEDATAEIEYVNAVTKQETSDSLTAEEILANWDDPELDGTDFAHPAWWRGNDEGVLQVTLQILRIWDEEGSASARHRLEELRDKFKKDV